MRLGGPGRPRPPSHPGRTALPDPGGPGAPSGGRRRCGALARVSPPPAAAPGAPAPHPPLPALFVTARLPVCGLPTPAHFPGREAAEGREFLGDSPPARLRLLQPGIPPLPGSPRRAAAARSRHRRRARGRDRSGPACPAPGGAVQSRGCAQPGPAVAGPGSEVNLSRPWRPLRQAGGGGSRTRL